MAVGATGAAVLTVRVAALTLLLLPATSFAQAALDGFWTGAFLRDGAAQAVTASFVATDSLRASISIPERPFATRGPAVARSGSDRRIVLPTQYGEARLVFDSTYQELVGPVGSDSLAIRLHLKRSVPAPRGVLSELVKFPAGGATLHGQLFRPAGVVRPAVAVFVHGRGCGPRDPDLRQRDGMYRWAEQLAAQGIATFAYDKRGTGRSEGDRCDALSGAQLSDDLASAVRHLRGRPDVDSSRVGAVGYSAGAWTSLRASRHVRLGFLVLFSGPGTSVKQQQLDGMYTVLRQLKLGGADSANAIRYVHLMFARTDRRARFEEMTRLAKEGERTGWAGLFISPGDLPRTEAESDSLWVQLNDYDPAPELRRYRAPLLAFFGERDAIVPSAENAEAIRRTSREAGNTRAQVVVIPEAGHTLEQGGRRRELEGGVGYWKFPRTAPVVWTELLSFLRHNGLVSDPAADQQSAAPAMRATALDFSRLRAFLGDWVGTRAGQRPFFERYALADDSTITMTNFADSTFASPSGESRVLLRGGEIRHESGRARWRLTRIDSLGLHFAPAQGTGNRFRWRKSSADRWEAVLEHSDGRVIRYDMRRAVRRAARDQP